MNSKTPVGIRAAMIGGIFVILAAIITVYFQNQTPTQQPSTTIVVNNNNNNDSNPSFPSVVPSIEEPSPTNSPMSTGTPVPPTNTPIAPSPTDTPVPTKDTPIPSTNTPLPMPTFTSESVVINFNVPGYLQDGVRVDIQLSGFYMLEYVGNSYSPWATDAFEGNKGWATHIQAFINQPVIWGETESGLLGPVHFSAYLGAPGYFKIKDDAAIATQGKSVRIGPLNAGDYVTFVTVDEQGQYADNRGGVDLALILVE